MIPNLSLTFEMDMQYLHTYIEISFNCLQSLSSKVKCPKLVRQWSIRKVKGFPGASEMVQEKN